MPEPLIPIGLDDDWLDDRLLEADKNERNWARRALNGTSIADAMAGVPRLGQITVKVPIQMWRDWKAHVVKGGLSQQKWLRQAIAAKLDSEGADRAVVQTWWDA